MTARTLRLAAKERFPSLSREVKRIKRGARCRNGKLIALQLLWKDAGRRARGSVDSEVAALPNEGLANRLVFTGQYTKVGSPAIIVFLT
jgi:hypothetical protein